MAIDVGSGKQLFTLADAVGLAQGAANDAAKNIQYQQALKGGYVLSDQQALNDIERMKTGKHLPDAGDDGRQYLGLAVGKLPWHPAASNESPYSIKGFKGAEAGDWDQIDGKWVYKPSQAQFDRNPNYTSELMNYFNNNKGKYVDSIQMPDGRIIK